MPVRKIPGTMNYYADDVGNIYNDEMKALRQAVDKLGYRRVTVTFEDGQRKSVNVHRLVAFTFLEHTRKPEHKQVNHRDGNPSNNRLDNLEWVTLSENNIHSEVIRVDNLYTTVLAFKDGIGVGRFKNVWEAQEALNIPGLLIWDAVRFGTVIDGISFVHRGYASGIPKELYRRINVTEDSRRAIKMRDIDTQVVAHYKSLHAAASAHNTGPSHIHRSIQTGDAPRLFRKQYQIVYEDMDFPVLTVSQLARARAHGPRSVMAYKVDEDRFIVYESAKKFMKDEGLWHYRIRITHALAMGILKVVEGWVSVYLHPEAAQQILAFVKGPANT